MVPDAGALDDFEGLGLNDASPEYGADADDSDAAASPSVESAGGGEDGKLREDGGGSSSSAASSPSAPEVASSLSSGACDGVVDIKAPIEEQESVGIPEPVEIEVLEFFEIEREFDRWSVFL